MNNPITIRQAVQADLPNVVSLWQEHQEYHAGIDPHFERAENANAGFLKFLQENLEEIGLFVAEADEKLVGFVLAEVATRPPCFAQREYGMIDDLAVTEARRGRGIGQRLVKQAMAWFEEKSIKRVETRVVMANELASRFWKEAGFEPYIQSLYKRA